ENETDEEEECEQQEDELTLDDLKNFEFKQTVNKDTTGKNAYINKCKEFDFFMFPVNSVVDKFNTEELDLSYTGLGDKGTIALAECLKVNTTIKTLILKDNYITPVGGEALMEALKQNRTIEHVDLSDNRLGLKSSKKEIGPMLGEMLKVNPTLKVLSLK